MSAEVIQGDCVAVMRGMDEASVDAVVTDPPYGIGFMGKEWDGKAISEAARLDRERRKSLGPESPSRPGRAQPRSSSAFGNEAIIAGPVRGGAEFQAWCETWATEALRVLKPGGHLLAFGGTRTYHRLACAIEDAGFEIRDCLAWLYGSGFPKSLDVGKAIDKAAGAEPIDLGQSPNWRESKRDREKDGSMEVRGENAGRITAPATPEAAQWQGWGTALKPSHEPVVLARKPLTGTVAGNVLAHGTGALNVDGCRVGSDGGGNACPGGDLCKCDTDGRAYSPTKHPVRREGEFGRWPANVILDEQSSALLDEQSGERKSGTAVRRNKGIVASSNVRYSGDDPTATEDVGYGDTGGASRFFPTFALDKLCVLCNLPCVESAGNSSPRNEAHNGIAPADARASQPPASEDSEAGSGTSAKSAGSSSRTTPPTVTAVTSIAPPDAPPKLAAWIVRLARSAESMCDSCATATAQRVAQTLQGQTPDSRPGKASTHERRLQTLTRNLALIAAGSRSTGITPTTADLKSSFGSALNATASGTETTTSESDQTRFRYQSKASRAERNAGLPEGERSSHPTVKPIALMRWLCRLVTPPGGRVLDPFLGSGTTGCAAMLEGFDFIGCERESEYVALAEARIAFWAQFPGAEEDDVLASDAKRDPDQLTFA